MFDFVSIAAPFGLGAALSWGIGDFFIARSARAIGGANASLLVNCLGALIYGSAYLLFLYNQTVFTNEGVTYALLGSVFFGFAQLMFFKAMSLGPVGLVSSISSTYPLIALIVGAIVFGTKVSLVHVVGIILVVGGVMVASGLLDLKGHSKNLGKGPLFALLPALCWGMGAGFLIQAINHMSWQGVFLIELIVAPTILLLLLPITKQKEVVTIQTLVKGLRRPIVWIAAICQMLGLLALNIGLSHAPNSGPVVVAISSCYPVLTIFLALRHLDEKIPIIPLAGGVAGVIGVVILALG